MFALAQQLSGFSELFEPHDLAQSVSDPVAGMRTLCPPAGPRGSGAARPCGMCEPLS